MEEQAKQYTAITLGEWMVTILITIIPIVNIVMLFVWGFSASTHPSKANWAKATLIWIAIIIGFYVLVALVILGWLAASSQY